LFRFYTNITFGGTLPWNHENQWNNQRHEFDELPNAVGAIDAFAVQINRKQGAAQRLYYRRDRGYHFLNFHVIIDNDGFFQFSRGGFLGHATDAASYARLPAMGYGQQLHLPRNSYLLADGGYPSVHPLVTPFRRPRRGRLNHIQFRTNIELQRARVRVGLGMQGSTRINGLVDCDMELEFNQRYVDLETKWPEDFKKWMLGISRRHRSLKDTLELCMLKSVCTAAGLGDSPNKWSNQRTESLNNVIKEEANNHVTDQATIHEIIQKLVKDQEEEYISAGV